MNHLRSTPMEPMEARSVDAIPSGCCWQYEPKWDGFRCILEREGADVIMTSKSGRDLTRYFPEVAGSARQLPEEYFILDGELVIPVGEEFSFDALLQRIHPAATRIKRLSRETPASYLSFDLLRLGATDYSLAPLRERRKALEDLAAGSFPGTLFYLSPASLELDDAKDWLKAAGGGSDGVIAKRLDLPYQAGNRLGMQKIKRHRSADCVVGGFRLASKPISGRHVVGSLLLGLYDEQGRLNHVGFTSALKDEDKGGLTERLQKLQTDESFTGDSPGRPSRWSSDRSGQWTPVKPRLVVEVSYDHVTGGRFRHGTRILRWRPDKAPRQCTTLQLQHKFVPPSHLLGQL